MNKNVKFQISNFKLNPIVARKIGFHLTFEIWNWLLPPILGAAYVLDFFCK